MEWVVVAPAVSVAENSIPVPPPVPPVAPDEDVASGQMASGVRRCCPSGIYMVVKPVMW